jgi:oligoendopeptidase F
MSITSRSEIKPQFDTLLAQEINSYAQLVSRIEATDVLDSQLSQDYAWRYIRQTTNTADEQVKQSYLDFTQQIYPEWIRVSDQIGRKLIASEFVSQLPSEYANLIRSVKHSVEMFREANVELSSKEKEIEAQFAEIM